MCGLWLLCVQKQKKGKKGKKERGGEEGDDDEGERRRRFKHAPSFFRFFTPFNAPKAKVNAAAAHTHTHTNARLHTLHSATAARPRLGLWFWLAGKSHSSRDGEKSCIGAVERGVERVYSLWLGNGLGGGGLAHATTLSCIYSNQGGSGQIP